MLCIYISSLLYVVEIAEEDVDPHEKKPSSSSSTFFCWIIFFSIISFYETALGRRRREQERFKWFLGFFVEYLFFFCEMPQCFPFNIQLSIGTAISAIPYQLLITFGTSFFFAPFIFFYIFFCDVPFTFRFLDIWIGHLHR